MEQVRVEIKDVIIAYYKMDPMGFTFWKWAK